MYDEKDRRYVPLLVALCTALLLAAVVGGLGYGLGKGQGQEPAQLSGVTEPQAGSAEPPPCGPAIEGADAALGLGARLDAALAQHSSVLDDLRTARATPEQVLERIPALGATTEQRQAFLDAVRDYEQARSGCLQ